MSELQPSNTDAVLGGQTPPPVNAAVLGGVAGIESQLLYQWGLSRESISRFSFETVFVNENAEIIERQEKTSFSYSIDINGISIEMVYIPPGSFLMGGFGKSEQPIHRVTLPSFFMGKYPVYEQQYLAVMGRKPHYYLPQDDRHPVVRVRLVTAIEYCQKLSEMTKKNFTLPSESQWEYACRAGTDTSFCFGKKINTDLVNYYDYECGVDRMTPVGIYPPNSWGLYDMHGNVWEWCLDTYHSNYMDAPSDGSAWIDFDGDEYGRYRNVCRGGSSNDSWDACASHNRIFGNTDRSVGMVGFRVCMLLNSDDRHSIFTN
jgi:formylglycine-generating enzyme required for sulfatase activity